MGRSRLKLIHVLFGGALCLLLGILISWVIFHTSAYEQFRKAYIFGESKSPNHQVRAASRLPRQENSEPWVVMFLLDKSDYSYEMSHKGISVVDSWGKVIHENFHKAVVGAMLGDIPDNAHKAVLLSVTTKLSEPERGRGLYDTYFAHGLAQTLPIRDIAR
ncbi:MAG: hypothetical protein JSW23_05325, partial [Planctomycetota bacterium]